ncbi:MAG: OmpA family protein [Gammaproteobacteria bacterium]|nr:OmpA family protein [Gammaproteobacteria bacterium]
MRILISLVISFFLLLVSGCTTYDAYTGEQKTSATAKGAGIGAGVGAVLAYLKNRDADSDDRRREMLKAAGIGAIAGGGVGYYMDSQEAKLRKQLRDTGVRVEREGDNINLIMPGNITFRTDSSDIQADFYPVLDSVALVIEEYNKTIVYVTGHTDSTGSESYNQALSQRRAESLATYLRSRKVNNSRLDVLGLGERHPVASNETAEGRQLNRRVEIALVPVTSE